LPFLVAGARKRDLYGPLHLGVLDQTDTPAACRRLSTSAR
jgi:hypothetical protein